MSNSQHRFVWYDLYTSAPPAALDFYKKIVGWKSQPFKEGADYEVLMASEIGVGGITSMPESMKANNVPPHWAGFVAVENVDATVEKAIGLGAKVAAPAFDMPEIGRIATLIDPQGANIGIYQPLTTQDVDSSRTAGNFTWNELATSDWEAAFAFYSELFGWIKSDSMETPMGTYQMYKKEGMEFALGGMYNRPPGVPVSSWLYYAYVADLDKSVALLKELGAKILNGPMEVPGGSRIVMFLDPQGAAFAINGK